MADETNMNGTESYFLNDDRVEEADALDTSRKMEELVDENSEMKAKVKRLNAEIEGLKSENEELAGKLFNLEKDVKVLNSVAARAADLEMEVSRLQHDLVSSMTEADESKAEIGDFKALIDGLQKEKASLIEKIVREECESKKIAGKVRELEEKLERYEKQELIVKGMEKELSETKEKLKASETKLERKESTLNLMEKELVVLNDKSKAWELKHEESEKELARSREMVKTLETKQPRLEEAIARELAEWKDKCEKHELTVKALEKELEESKKLNSSGSGSATGYGEMGLKFQWPAAVASVGTIAVASAAMYYLKLGRRY